MPQSLQIVFHGINRSPAVETAVTEKVEAPVASTTSSVPAK